MASLGVAQPFMPLQVQRLAIDPQVRVGAGVGAQLALRFPTHRAAGIRAFPTRATLGVGSAEPSRVVAPGDR